MGAKQRGSERIMSECNEKWCVLCNTCSYCEGAADLYNPATWGVICIECVKEGALDEEEEEAA